MKWNGRPGCAWIPWRSDGQLQQHQGQVLLQCHLRAQLGSRRDRHGYRRCLQKLRIEAMKLSTTFEIRSAHLGGVACLALESWEQRYLLSGGVDGSIALYDLEQGSSGPNSQPIEAIYTSCTETAKHTLSISSLEWYPEDSGAFLSSSLDGRLLVWDTESFSLAGEFQLHQRINHSCTRTTAIGSAIVACALADKSIRICDTSTMDSCHVLHGHKDAVTQVAFSPNAQYQLASSSYDGAIKIWDIRKGGASGELLSFDWQQDHTATAESLFGDKSASVGLGHHPSHASGRTLLTKMDSSKQQAAKAHDAPIMSLKYSPCGNYLISSGNDQKVRVWAADTGALSPINFDLQGQVSRMPFQMEIAAFSCSGDDLLIYPNGHDIALLPLHSSNGGILKTLRGHVGPVTSLVYRSSLQQVLSASRDGLIFLWDAGPLVGGADNARGAAGGRAGPGRLEITIQIPSGQQDAWSDDDEVGANVARVAPMPRYFVPPIIQQFIDGSARQRRAARSMTVRESTTTVVNAGRVRETFKTNNKAKRR